METSSPVDSSELSSHNSSPDDNLFHIVGIGASAGGIKAMKDFFEKMPVDAGMAYVVILHLSPDHDSRLAQVLQTVTTMPVLQTNTEVIVEPNHVYVVPPNQHLEMLGNKIVVSKNTRIEDRRAPIDIFFRTLAESHGKWAIGVVLSGTGANGSMGIKRIKEMGGSAFVQNPREAEFSEMPRNSIATDLIDMILPVAEIPGKIIQFIQGNANIELPAAAEALIENQQLALRDIFTQLRVRTGHDFSNYKRPTLLRRIERRMNICNQPDIISYATFIQQDPTETQALLKDLLISVTNFFRDEKAFRFIETDILPRIFHGKDSQKQVRIWVAGCATGEEAYSLAMLCAERTLGNTDMPKVQIFATDIDENAIAIARGGVYTLNDAADVSSERLRRFFKKDGNVYQVTREIREMILFANHNVLKDAPFSRIDLITCRNMLIYLNQVAQERIMETFHFALNPGGFLFLGTSESIETSDELFSIISREQHIYQSRHVTVRSYPVPESIPALRFQHLPNQGVREPPDNKTLERFTYNDLHQLLLEQYAPPSVVVNEGYNIVHLSPRAGSYLQMNGGEPSTNVLHLVRQELRLELRSALYQAVQQKTNVQANNLTLKIDDKFQTINLHVRPQFREGEVARGFILILFEKTENGIAEQPAVLKSEEPLARQLEEELIRLKAQLRESNQHHEFQAEELKASNEELQAINEELRSAAEELETSKEELQSINEELTTVNQELKVKIEETTISSNNLQNLINSTNIGTIFLDRSFCINLFTPAIRDIFNLIPADYGRPLTDINSKLTYDNLIEDAEEVLANLQPIEREVQTNDNRTFMMRVLPYRTSEDRISGIVITFVDISRRKKDENELYDNRNRLHLAMKAGKIFTWELNPETRQLVWSANTKDIIGCLLPDLLDNLYSLIHPDDIHHAKKAIDTAIENRLDFESEFRLLHPDTGQVIWLQSQGAVTTHTPNGNALFVGIVQNISDRKKAEDELRQSYVNIKMATDASQAGWLTWHLETGQTNWDERGKQIMGFSSEEETKSIEGWLSRILDADRHVVMENSAENIVNNKDFEFEFRVPDDKTGEERLIEAKGRFQKDTQDRAISGTCLIIDITESRRAELALRESEERFRILANSIPQLIWTNDAGGKADYFNKRWYEYSGLNMEELAGHGWQKIVFEEDAATFIERWKDALQSGTIFDSEFRIRRADGMYRWHIVRNMPLLSKDGSVHIWFGSATDVDDLKNTQELLRESRERLRVTMESALDYAIVTLNTDGLIEAGIQVPNAFLDTGKTK